MFTKTVELLLNHFGILNFQYSRATKQFAPNSTSAIVSGAIFFCLQLNVIFLFSEMYFWSESLTQNGFSKMVSIADYINWSLLCALNFGDRILYRKKYVAILNKCVAIEKGLNQLSEPISQKYARKWLRTFYWGLFGIGLHFLVYFISKHEILGEKPLLAALKDALYSFFFTIYLVGNIFVEMMLFYRFVLFIQVLKECGTTRNLALVLRMYDESFTVLQELANQCMKLKMVQIPFLYVSFPVMFFYLYDAFVAKVSSILTWTYILYWLAELFFIIFSCSPWESSVSKVKFIFLRTYIIVSLVKS